MKAWMLVAALFAITPMASAQATPNQQGIENKGRAVVQDLSTGKFVAVEALYDPAMKKALPPGKLATAWQQLTGQVGAFQKISSIKTELIQGYQQVLATCAFEKAALVMQMTFSSDGQLAGLRFLPAPPKQPWMPPAYADPKSFHEEPLTVVDGKYELPGTLTIPNGNGPFPGVVLVQGSGPQDQDETIGPEKPFKDLAWGLATKGIVVLRYTKRTLKYGAQSSANPDALTVDDETISDARAAVALLQKQMNVTAKHVFLLGHSLGAMLAPRIAAGDSQIAGIIVMAGNTRPMEQLIVDQIRYLTSLPGVPPEQAQKEIAAAEGAKKQIEDPNLKPGTYVSVLGAKIPASYWLDLRGYHPAATAAQLTIPVLVLQGGRDYQVTKSEYDGWQKALAGHSNATLKWYPALNHLFMEGSGPSTPAEYKVAGHVSEQVITDIATWLSREE